AVCALVTLALTGVGASAEAYGSHGRRQGGHHGSEAAHQHTRLEQDGSSRVLHALGRLDRRLVHATRDHRLTPLTDADRAALQINADTDEAAVEAAATAYSAHPSPGNLAAAEDVLRGYHA